MIDRIVKWFRDFFALDLDEEMKAAAQPLILAHGAPCTVTAGSTLTANLPAPPAYIDAGVFYFYDNPVCFTGYMDRVEGKATKGTYRCDGQGKYYFSKKDKGTAVIILFTFKGELHRRQVTI